MMLTEKQNTIIDDIVERRQERHERSKRPVRRPMADVMLCAPLFGFGFGMGGARLGRSGAAVPVVTSADQVDVSGGDVSVVVGTSFIGATAVTVAGVSCPFVVLSSTKLLVVTPPKPAATYTVAVTTPGGTSSGTNNIVYWTNVDANTTLRLQRGNYVGDTWTDDSGNGQHFTDATLYPPEEVKEPQFNETTASTILLGSSVTAASLFAAGPNYSISTMFRARALAVASGSTPDNAGLICDASAYWGLFISATSVRFRNVDTGENYVEIVTSLSLNEWHVIDVECNAGQLRMRIDGGAWSSPVTVGNLGSSAGITRVGQNHDGTKKLNGDVRGIVVSKIARGDTWFDQNLERWRVSHGFKSVAGEPEIDFYDDVHDPAGGTRLVVKGRGLASASGYVGDTALTNVKVFGAMPDFKANELDLAGTANTYHNGTAISGWALLRANHVKNDNSGGSIFLNDSIVATGGTAEYGVVLRSSGKVCLYIYDGAGYTTVETIAPIVGSWMLVQWKYDGTDLKIRVNGAERATTAAPASAFLAGTLHIGRNYNADAAYGLDAAVAEVGLADGVLSDADEDNVLAGINYDTGLNLGGVAASAFDRATLTPTLLLQPGNYALGTWTASVGGDATEVTNPPRVSDGEWLVATMPAKSAGKQRGPMPLVHANNRFALPLANNVAIGANGFIYAVINADQLPAPAGTDYSDGNLFTDLINAETTFGVTSSGVCAAIYSGGYKRVDLAWPGQATGTWHLVAMRYNGTQLEISLDGGAWTSLLCGSPTFLSTSTTVSIGRAYSAANVFAGKILEWGSSTVAHSDADLANIIAGINYDFDLNIGGVTPAAFDRATLSWTALLKKYSRTSSVGTWSDTPSAGTSGTNHATTQSPIPYQEWIESTGTYPLMLVTASGEAANTNAIRAANPSTIPENVWWLRPDDADVDVDGSNNVTTWRDKSGLGDSNRDVANATPGTWFTPPWNASDADYGGKPTVGSFDLGTADICLLRSGVWSSSYATFTIGVIGHAVDASSRYFTHGDSTRYNAIVNAVGVVRAYGGDSTPTIVDSTFNSGMTRPRSLGLAVFNGASSRLYGDKAILGISGDLGSNTLGSVGMNVGSYPSGSSTFGTTRVREVFAYSRPLSLAEVRTLRRYRDTSVGKVSA